MFNFDYVYKERKMYKIYKNMDIKSHAFVGIRPPPMHSYSIYIIHMYD